MFRKCNIKISYHITIYVGSNDAGPQEDLPRAGFQVEYTTVQWVTSDVVVYHIVWWLKTNEAQYLIHITNELNSNILITSSGISFLINK